jgi:hypothetical protein
VHPYMSQTKINRQKHHDMIIHNTHANGHSDVLHENANTRLRTMIGAHDEVEEELATPGWLSNCRRGMAPSAIPARVS